MQDAKSQVAVVLLVGMTATGLYLQAGVCLKVSNLAGAIVAVVVSMHCHKLDFVLVLLLRLLLLLLLLLLLPRVCSRRCTILLTGICCHRMCLVLLLLRLLLIWLLPLLLPLLLPQRVCSRRHTALLNGMCSFTGVVQLFMSNSCRRLQ